ncbi:MAG TPA: choice-of-anchor V domain-containing protein [Woeseiaceae bacterium]|nr:choice-of-anchor V domain-containing protein [Woeseiaceae bacterium]
MLRALLAALLALAAAAARGYEDGAPPGHTGGFGEPDCSACHSDNEKNAPAGSLVVEGWPAAYAPGKSYPLTLVLRHPELASGGFQLALRTADGQPAGELVAASDRLQVATEAGQPYLQHTREGTQTETGGRIRWEFEWRAPATGEPVVLNVAANAANDDLSSLGDHIYTLEEALAPVGAGRGAEADQESVTGSSRKR